MLLFQKKNFVRTKWMMQGEYWYNMIQQGEIIVTLLLKKITKPWPTKSNFCKQTCHELQNISRLVYSVICGFNTKIPRKFHIFLLQYSCLLFIYT